MRFVSDRAARFPDRADEQANLWLWDIPGSGEPRQLTHQAPAEGYVRDSTTDGRRVVWHSKGRLWMLDDVESAPRPLDVPVPVGAPSSFAATDRAPRPPRPLPRRRRELRGPTWALVTDSGVRVREPVLLGRTGQAVLVTDAEGEDALEVDSLTGSAAPAGGSLGRVLHLASDPAGK